MKRLLVLMAIIAVIATGTAYAQNMSTTGERLQSAYAESNAMAGTLVAQETTPAAPTTPQPNVIVQEEKLNSVYGIGASIGIYIPTSSEVRDIFGDTRVRYGLRPLPISVPPKWVPSFDVSYYTMSDDDNKATVIPITVGIIRGYPINKNLRGYTSVNVGPYYGSVKIPDDKIDDKGWGVSANATAGVIFNRNFSLEARYELMNDIGGLNFSALTFSAAVKLVEVKF